jgi:hypothetical protein
MRKAAKRRCEVKLAQDNDGDSSPPLSASLRYSAASFNRAALAAIAVTSVAFTAHADVHAARTSAIADLDDAVVFFSTATGTAYNAGSTTTGSATLRPIPA